MAYRLCHDRSPTMRMLPSAAKLALLMALAFGLHVRSGSASFPDWGLSHDPHHNQRDLPSHSRSRNSSRARGSHNWESSEAALAEEARSHPPAIAQQALRPGARYHAHLNRSFHARFVTVGLPSFGHLTEPLTKRAIVARGSAPRAPGSPRGPPLS